MGDKIDVAMAAALGGRFQIFSGVLMAFTKDVGGVERKMLRGIASSTVKDLHGDRMTDNAISKMETSAQKNLTIFLNHSYEVPEDVAGSVTEAHTTRDATETAADGLPIALLHFEIAINEQNDRAVKAWSAIQGGTKLGLSIGAMIPDGGATWDKTAQGYIIDDIELLETSIVGIPANPKSWVEYAVKALGGRPSVKAAQPLEVGKPQVTLDAESGEYQIRGQLGDITVVRGSEPSVTEPVTQADAAAAEPAAGDTDDPDKQASSITVIQIDTGNDGGSSSSDDSAGSSSESDPETGADGTTNSAGTSGVTRALELLGLSATALRTSNDLIVALSADLETTRTQRDEAVARAGEAEEAARKALKTAADTLERVKNLPLGRKAVVADVEDSFHRSVADVFSPAALKVLATADADRAKAVTTK